MTHRPAKCEDKNGWRVKTMERTTGRGGRTWQLKERGGTETVRQRGESRRAQHGWFFTTDRSWISKCWFAIHYIIPHQQKLHWHLQGWQLLPLVIFFHDQLVFAGHVPQFLQPEKKTTKSNGFAENHLLHKVWHSKRLAGQEIAVPGHDCCKLWLSLGGLMQLQPCLPELFPFLHNAVKQKWGKKKITSHLSTWQALNTQRDTYCYILGSRWYKWNRNAHIRGAGSWRWMAVFRDVARLGCAQAGFIPMVTGQSKGSLGRHSLSLTT